MLVALDAGHGALDNKGNYVTPGKRAVWPGFTIYEGVLNRAVLGLVQYQLSLKGVRSYVVSEQWQDIALSTRAGKANTARADLFLSFHSNAGGGTGFELWTTEGEDKSDDYAKVYGQALETHFAERGVRYRRGPGGTYDKEKDFTVIYKSQMPAILFEFLFMDNEADSVLLQQNEVLAEYADVIAQTTLKLAKDEGLL